MRPYDAAVDHQLVEDPYSFLLQLLTVVDVDDVLVLDAVDDGPYDDGYVVDVLCDALHLIKCNCWMKMTMFSDDERQLFVQLLPHAVRDQTVKIFTTSQLRASVRKRQTVAVELIAPTPLSNARRILFTAARKSSRAKIGLFRN